MTALSPVHTIGSQLRDAIRHSGVTGRSAQRTRAVELLDQVHIPRPTDQLSKYPHQLSGGMLQRVLIAAALAAGPELIVADEPTSALDVTVQASILDLLLELQERTGVAMLLITHDLGVARLMSDRIFVMKEGRFVEGGSAEALLGNPQSAYTKRLLDAVPRLDGHPGMEVPA
jgi:peptide/nickel transport system ATP-binding protein